MDMEGLLAGHRAFLERCQRESAYFRDLAEHGQHPRVLWIGCSDARVVPEMLTGARPGDLFVVRNVANIVPPADTADAGVGAAIEYAVGHLHVPHAIVCGHTGCGGISALVHGGPHAGDAHLRRWLSHARAARESATQNGAAPEDLLRRAIEANALLQRQHLLSYPCVREAVAAGRLALHVWIHDIASGQVATLTDASTWALLP